ncbi:hypothetical protein L873DRAFT_1836835 [Choiromyces venosus 120613-1]|uniref:DDE Tnp4 domain-containing protein n=1 Tax=Choiromyces venosus 120613-1 TaxID=1336337 RepID=A0A3N4JHS8_9PEZI|nr:hypothetical protein L873DRAFT_1836835 [Choiromyces venosus 120613-1]
MPRKSHRTQIVQNLVTVKVAKHEESKSSSSSSDNEIEQVLQQIVTRRFLHKRQIIPQSTAAIDLRLAHCYEFPEIFREYAQIDPSSFDLLVLKLQPHHIFHNHSYNTQMPVDRQLLITLYRLGHYGNGVSVKHVADWGGVSVGTVKLVTKRVFMAILDSTLQSEHIRWPAAQSSDQERVKEMVEERTIHEWRNGWVMIDSTLIPLYQRPYYYGEVFFDRKSNYSLNIVNTPTLKIVNYAVGFVGSRTDSTAWKET